MQKSVYEHTASATRKTSAPASALWDVLARLDHMATWAPGINQSIVTSSETEGVGAVRQVVSAQFGDIEQVVTAWEVGKKLSYVTNVSGPFVATLTTYQIEQADEDGATVNATLAFDLQPGTMPPEKARAALEAGLAEILKALEAQAVGA